MRAGHIDRCYNVEFRIEIPFVGLPARLCGSLATSDAVLVFVHVVGISLPPRTPSWVQVCMIHHVVWVFFKLRGVD